MTLSNFNQPVHVDVPQGAIAGRRDGSPRVMVLRNTQVRASAAWFGTLVGAAGALGMPLLGGAPRSGTTPAGAASVVFLGVGRTNAPRPIR